MSEVSNLCVTWRDAELEEVCLESLTTLAKWAATAAGLVFFTSVSLCVSFFNFFLPTSMRLEAEASEKSRFQCRVSSRHQGCSRE